jgi:predicted RNase H-like HicB family nuclease
LIALVIDFMEPGRYTHRRVSGSMEQHFTLEYWLDDGWFVGRLREVPGVFSQGATLGELEEGIADAYATVTSDSFDPVPSSEIHRKELIIKS